MFQEVLRLVNDGGSGGGGGGWYDALTCEMINLIIIGHFYFTNLLISLTFSCLEYPLLKFHVPRVGNFYWVTTQLETELIILLN